MMKTATAIILCLMLLTAVRFAVADTDVNFSGTLVETPCVLDPKDKEIEIDVGSVIVKYLYSYQRSPGTPFAVHLLNCDLSLGKEVTIWFEGSKDPLQPDYLAVQYDNGNGAQGVAIGIETAENIFMPIFEKLDFIALKPGDNIINLKAFVSAEREAIAQRKIFPGSLFTLATFHLDYQ